MINKSQIVRVLSLNLLAAALILIGGEFFTAAAQRDPFLKPSWARTREARPAGSGSSKSAGPQSEGGTPGIERRIDFYKRLREEAAASGKPIPKVTTVLTLDEMAVTGIFRTPRGYAAMVEATPIKLSYTIYPGDKFFDGQLVAVEENRLVFRRVAKTGAGKFVASVENKPLRKFTDLEQIQGTAPATAASDSAVSQPAAESSAMAAKAAAPSSAKPVVSPIVSPLEEMNRQTPSEASNDKSKKDSRKPVKVAKNKK